MAKYAIVVPASTGYEAAITALINSVNRHCAGIDIHVLSYDLTPEDIPMENVKLIPMPDVLPIQKANICRSYRWKYISELTGYEAACIMDADFFLVRDISKFFRIAAKAEQLVVTSDCTNILYGEAFRARYPDIFEEDFYNTKTHCAVPIFMNPDIHRQIFATAHWYITTVPNLNDTYAINFAIAKSEHWKDTIVLPAYAWTGIHHAMMKPETRIRKILNQFVSEAGDEVYMIHGRWFDEGWMKGLRIVMQGYFKNHFKMTDEQIKHFLPWVDDAIKVSVEEFRSLL